MKGTAHPETTHEAEQQQLRRVDDPVHLQRAARVVRAVLERQAAEAAADH